MSSSPERVGPHDRLFRAVFSRVAHALAPLRLLVGPQLAPALDWSSLRFEPGTYVEASLRGSMSDLVFSVRFRGSQRRALAYVLWEHMRDASRLMPLRMVNYGGQALRQYTERQDAISGYLPVLVPIVIVQSGRWPGPRLLSELHALPDEPPPPRVFLDLEMIVHELREGSLPEAELTLLARITLRLLRLAARGELVVAHAVRLTAWVDQVHRTYGYDDWRGLLEYIAATSPDEALMQAIIKNTREEIRPEPGSIMDKAETRGRTAGHTEGRTEGSREALLLLLEHRFGPVPGPVHDKLREASVAELQRWILQTADAATLDAALRDA